MTAASRLPAWTPFALALVLALGVAGAAWSTSRAATPALPYYGDAAFTPQWFEPGTVPDDFHAIAPFALTDQRGRTVTEADLDGRITVANFFFASCPGVCPATMGNMARLQTAFADDDGVQLVSHSVTPERDSPEVLAAFGEQMHAVADRWRLVTGDRATIYALGKRSYFADEDLGEARAADDAAFTHTESFLLLDGDRRIRGVYNGMNAAAVAQLVEDVRTLQREKG